MLHHAQLRMSSRPWCRAGVLRNNKPFAQKVRCAAAGSDAPDPATSSYYSAVLSGADAATHYIESMKAIAAEHNIPMSSIDWQPSLPPISPEVVKTPTEIPVPRATQITRWVVARMRNEPWAAGETTSTVQGRINAAAEVPPGADVMLKPQEVERGSAASVIGPLRLADLQHLTDSIGNIRVTSGSAAAAAVGDLTSATTVKETITAMEKKKVDPVTGVTTWMSFSGDIGGISCHTWHPPTGYPLNTVEWKHATRVQDLTIQVLTQLHGVQEKNKEALRRVREETPVPALPQGTSSTELHDWVTAAESWWNVFSDKISKIKEDYFHDMLKSAWSNYATLYDNLGRDSADIVRVFSDEYNSTATHRATDATVDYIKTTSENIGAVRQGASNAEAAEAAAKRAKEDEERKWLGLGVIFAVAVVLIIIVVSVVSDKGAIFRLGLPSQPSPLPGDPQPWQLASEEADLPGGPAERY